MKTYKFVKTILNFLYDCRLGFLFINWLAFLPIKKNSSKKSPTNYKLKKKIVFSYKYKTLKCTNKNPNRIQTKSIL